MHWLNPAVPVAGQYEQTCSRIISHDEIAETDSMPVNTITDNPRVLKLVSRHRYPAVQRAGERSVDLGDGDVAVRRQLSGHRISGQALEMPKHPATSSTVTVVREVEHNVVFRSGG